MIEPHVIAPAHVVVTLRAILTFLPAVRIVIAVAGNAGGSEAHPPRRLRMALRTTHARMSAMQREAGPVMIERRLMPVADIVTIGAGRAVRAVVGVILPMAGQAIGRQAHLPGGTRVAGLALRRCMRAAQRKLGAVVVEAQ